MKIYMGSNSLEVKYDGLKYKVESFEMWDNHNWGSINLELIAGWDYINPDENDIQGWCPPERFVEDVQSDSATWYFKEESMEEALEQAGFTIVKKGGE